VALVVGLGLGVFEVVEILVGIFVLIVVLLIVEVGLIVGRDY